MGFGGLGILLHSVRGCLGFFLVLFCCVHGTFGSWDGIRCHYWLGYTLRYLAHDSVTIFSACQLEERLEVMENVIQQSLVKGDCMKVNLM